MSFSMRSHVQSHPCLHACPYGVLTWLKNLCSVTSCVSWTRGSFLVSCVSALYSARPRGSAWDCLSHTLCLRESHSLTCFQFHLWTSTRKASLLPSPLLNIRPVSRDPRSHLCGVSQAGPWALPTSPGWILLL